MKKSILLGLGALAMAVGAGVGLAAHKAVETNAAPTPVSGTMTVDMQDGYWAANYKCNLAMYFFGGEGGTETWSNLVYCDTGTVFAEIPYSLSFTPANMILVRLSDEATVGNWDDKWDKSADLTFVNNANLIVHGAGDKNVDVALPWIMSSESGWGKKMDLSSVKLNGSSHVEYFSDSVSLAKDEKFKVVRRGTYFGDDNCELSAFVKGKFEIKPEDESDDDIKCTEAGVYAFYFDATGKLFITDPVAAAADEWAQKFLGTDVSTDNCDYSKTHWGASETSYTSLSSSVKAMFVAADHIDHEAATKSYLEKAVQRYDYVIQRYGTGSYTDFIGRSEKIPSLARIVPTGSMSQGTNPTALLVGVVGAVALVSVGGFFFLHKRKED